MRRATCCLLVVLSVSWASSLGQHAPKLTSPQIVATFQRLGQTKEIKPVTLYTPPPWGTFRISIVIVGTIANVSAAFWAAKAYYSDAAGNENVVETDLDENT